MFAGQLQHFLYKRIAKPIFFRQDPEEVHDRMVKLGSRLGRSAFMRSIMSFFFEHRDGILSQDVLGIRFQNPIGLAAGFDKNAELTRVLPSVGFGFEEVGSVTGMPCEGNPKPRLWRHPELQSLRVYYGLKNDGCEKISKKLEGKTFDIPIGVSITKTNCKETADADVAIDDYVKAYKVFSTIGSYDTINISCPNAYGGQPFGDPERLGVLLGRINKCRAEKPIFLKLSPDFSLDEIHAIAVVAKKHNINGLICSNLKKKHDLGKGGLSGKPVASRAHEHLSYLYKTFPGEFVLVSCGGIFAGEDVYDRIRHGASLVQLITGMIYQGPQIIGQMNKTLARLLKEGGFNHIADAIGSAHR